MRIEDEKFLAALVLALGVVVAFQFDGLASGFTGYLMPSLFCVMVFSLLPYVNYESQIFTSLHPAVIPLVIIQQLALPAIVASAGWMLDLDSQIIFFIMVTLTSGSLFASPTLVHLMGLDQKLAVQTVIISTLVAPISIFVGFSLLHDGHFEFDLVNFEIRLFALLIVPLCIFFLIRRWARNWTPRSRELSIQIGRWGSVFSLVIFCFALEAPVVEALRTDSQKVLFYFSVSVVTSLTVAVVLRIVMARLGYTVAMTASVLASFRNIGLTFGLVGYANDANLAVYVGASQIPMFFAPLLFEIIFGRNVRLYNDSNAEHAIDPEADYAGEQNNTVRSAGTATGVQHMHKTSRPLKTTTNVAMTSGIAVGANTMSAQTATQIAETAPQKIDHQPELSHEETHALLGRLEVLLDELEGQYKSLVTHEKLERWHGGRFVFMTLLLFVAGVTAIWHANKYFAPMLFDQKMIADVAQTHSEGRNYAVFDLNINIRDLRNETIKRMTKTPEVGILGASHWQEAHVSLLPGIDLYNSHIHRDYYEDMMAMVEIYERHDRLPPELIITIRDKLLTPVKDRTDFLWLPGIKYYRAFAARNNFEPHAVIETLPVQTWRELVNFPLLKMHGMRHLTAPVMPHATDERNFEGLDTLLPGGSILWSAEHQRLFSQERARNEALMFAEASKNSPPKIDPKGIEHMEFLFEYLKAKGVKVTLAHPQFNPIFWDAVQGTDYMDGLRKIEDLTQEWAQKYGFGVIGGFAPEDVGCKALQYIDAEHGDPACLGLLLDQYRTQRNETVLSGAL